MMRSALERLQSLLIADVMSKAIVQVSSSQTMSEAAEVFMKNNVSAAPVVNEQGRCVGILSSTDFMKRECKCQSEDSSLLTMDNHRLVQETIDEPLKIVSSAGNLARSYMTTAIQSVPSGTLLLSAARIMLAEHIHHLLVIDEQERPVGIVSTMDVVAALVNAVEEMNAADVKRSCK